MSQQPNEELIRLNSFIFPYWFKQAPLVFSFSAAVFMLSYLEVRVSPAKTLESSSWCVWSKQMKRALKLLHRLLLDCWRSERPGRHPTITSRGRIKEAESELVDVRSDSCSHRCSSFSFSFLSSVRTRVYTVQITWSKVCLFVCVWAGAVFYWALWVEMCLL